MKILSLYGAMPGLDYGLTQVNKIIYDTFTELGETVSEAIISAAALPYYDGLSSLAAEKIMEDISSADGVIFSYVTHLFAPCAIMQTFLEHLNADCLNNKNLFIITSAFEYGEGASLAYVSRVVNSMGGYCAVSLGLNSGLLKSIDEPLKNTIEKYAEDYYRIIRQNRRFIIPSDAPPAAGMQPPAGGNKNAPLSQEAYEALFGLESKAKVTSDELRKKLDLNSFTLKQEQDIDEITQFFAHKYREDVTLQKGGAIFTEQLTPTASPAPRLKTCRQMTQNLPHYFQPQLANGITACIQISISGEENFDGYLAVDGANCEYTDGIAQNPDITILCDSSVFTDVLKGKHTAQKAFMIGHLKVRGNFVLLTKFDQLFKIGG